MIIKEIYTCWQDELVWIISTDYTKDESFDFIATLYHTHQRNSYNSFEKTASLIFFLGGGGGWGWGGQTKKI